MAEKDRAVAAVAGAAGGSLLTYFLTRSKEARAAAPEGVDQEVWDMLLALVEAIAAQTDSIDALVSTLGGVPAAVEDPFENTPKFITGQLICPIAFRGYPLPPFPIPKNKQLVVKALPLNTGYIYVAYTRADSQNMLVAWPLDANEGVGLFVKNASAVWVMADTINEGVAFTVEQG